VIFYMIRFLFWLTINYPAVGIPVDIVVIVVVIRLRTSSGPTRCARSWSAAT